MQKPTKPCCICGTNDWWLTPEGRYLCGRCHPNPNPGSNPALPATEGKYSQEVLALHDRVIQGNKKLNLAWGQICQLDRESQEQRTLGEQWDQANKKLRVLCDNLQGMGYTDCLYLDQNGKKTKKCLPTDDPYGCRVCPSAIPYWRQE